MQTALKSEKRPHTGADAFAQWLRDQDVELVFSVMGNQVNDIAFALQYVGIRLITCRHEGTATMMAEAYARSSRRIAMVLVIPGPGVSNTASGLLEAQMTASPVLVVSVRQPVRFPDRPADKLFHGLKHCQFTQAITGFSATVTCESDFDIHLRQAYRTLHGDRPRPVFLEFTVDFLRGELGPKSVQSSPVVACVPNAGRLHDAVRLISSSQRVLIIAGRAVIAAGAEAALLGLAEHLQAPVLTTTLGKGGFPERHALYLGKLYEPACRDLIADADLVIAIGTRFSQVDTDDWRIPLSAPLIQIDPDTEQFNSVYACDVALCGELKQTLGLLQGMLAQTISGWDVAALSRDVGLLRGPAPLVASLLHELLLPGDIIAVDVHEQGYPLVEHLLLDQQAFLFSGTSLCLGYGIPAAIGARLAHKQGRVMAFCGDGGFLMSSCELATVAHYGLAIVFVIVNDQAFGTIKNHQLEHFGATAGVELTNPDFKALTHSFGFDYRAINHHEDLHPVLWWALDQTRPTVIEIDKALLH